MKTVYLVRHGESSSNVGGIILGGPKTSLTDRGRKQASSVAERISHVQIEIIVASPYLRTRQTAEEIAKKLQKQVEYSDLFVEWNQGSERIGRKVDDPAIILQTQMLIERIGESGGRLADEETFEDLNRRADRALRYLLDRPEARLAVVGHGWFSPVLVGKAIMGDDFTGRDCRHFMKAFRMLNTGISVLTYGEPVSAHSWGEWNLITWNDHAHLG